MQGLSIIIAAHNEAAGIAQTLKSILASRINRPLQIIVVANGCTDETARIARSFPGVEVIETPVGNKIHALNLGDAAARSFPRAYLDADIQLSEDALQKVADAFADDQNLRVAAPRPRHLYRGWNPILAGYYKLWSSLPYVRNAIMGSGFYAIDSTLRARFAEFPAITADDKFIRNLAQPHERRIVEGCHVTVIMPATFSDLLRVKTRWTYGNLELARTHPQLNANDRDRYQGARGWLLRRPWMWINVPAFLFVFAYAKIAARRKLALKQNSWARDGSTRKNIPSSGSPDDAQPAHRPAA